MAPVSLDFLLLHSHSLWWKGHLFFFGVSSRMSCMSSQKNKDNGKTSDNKKLAEKVFNISDTWVWNTSCRQLTLILKKKKVNFFLYSIMPFLYLLFENKSRNWVKSCKGITTVIKEAHWKFPNINNFYPLIFSTIFQKRFWKLNILSKKINEKKHSFWVLILYWIFASLDLPEFLIAYLCLASNITWWHNWK